MKIEARLEELGLTLPAERILPEGVTIPFSWVRVRGSKAFISGQSAANPDGTMAGPFGKVPSEVSFDDARLAARGGALTILSSLKRELGDLDRISAWLMVNGMVNADPGYDKTTMIINGFSELMLEVFGPEIGAHARTAVGMAALPLNTSVVIAAEVEID